MSMPMAPLTNNHLAVVFNNRIGYQNFGAVCACRREVLELMGGEYHEVARQAYGLSDDEA